SDSTTATVSGAGERRGCTSVTTPPATDTAPQPSMMPTICLPVMDGNSTDAVSTTDSVIKIATTAEVNTFVPRRFTQGPSTERSLHSSSKNTVALGSSTPASTWTPSVSRP